MTSQADLFMGFCVEGFGLERLEDCGTFLLIALLDFLAFLLEFFTFLELLFCGEGVYGVLLFHLVVLG
jgi:hypothetical protein